LEKTGETKGWNEHHCIVSGREDRSTDGVARLWVIDTGKVITKWTGHTVGDISVLEWRRMKGREWIL
jgi:hypothetical protein